ncbi:multifunctional CCA tRNA nucleotidyl transferase/2'3'-cyclic phosphodiesterase/2'nucleotidase/phosphatase [Ramlibacter sp. PS4R-6]|uniref:multifunctional CCA tRNA nucleotidyl transferase/2'3'-cyclic phosphodiesterase/2'nucleotidase/phosphatase n=1 Tax=Ramlibacter sp. PS4R-6 TaxID=3133438 RepID=UPI0030B292B3
MQTYIVGGAVRDALLGLPVNDRDWVVVGASPQQLIAAGFLPVGKDFPVFLHPETREEYALARTERKTARGYHGFAFHAEPTVTLEQDLARRDLTINAMAQDPQGRIVDPFQGQRDLKARVLRHVTEAFREDPVRILRLARFAARFSDFRVAPETLHLMRGMVDAGEADALVAERVWQEFARGLMEREPARMFDVLRECGALARLLPELDARWDAALARVLAEAAHRDAPLPVRFACLVHGLGEGLRGVCERLRVPTECRELAEVVAREHGNVDASGQADAETLVRLLEHCDAFRKPQRFDAVLLACECIARGHGAKDYPQAARLQGALAAAQEVPTHEIAESAQAQGLKGPQVGEKIQRARVEAVARALGG